MVFDTFFSLLRSGLYGCPIPEAELPVSIDWPAIVAIARKHTVLGIIIDSIQFLPPALRPSGSLAAKIAKFSLGQIQANAVLDRAAARLSAYLKDKGINGVLLKGQGVARYYRIPELRHSGDIDYYVGRSVYKKAVDICRNHLSDTPETESETDQHFDFFMGGIPIELHRIASRIYTPLRNRRFQRWTVEQLEHPGSSRTVSLCGVDVTVPSYDFDAIFIFYHAWRHFIMGGIGLRQLCDWAMVFHTHAADIDVPRLVDNLDRFGMTAGWKLFGCIAVNHLGLAAELMPLYDPAFSPKSEQVLADIMDGGNFGYYSKEYLRTKGRVSGFGYGLNKVRAYTKYYFSLFPLAPVEATFLYFHRMVFGTISCTLRSLNHHAQKP